MEMYLACRVRRPPVVVRDTRYVHAFVSAHRFFGFEEVAVLGRRVQMATAERAILDAIDRPRLAGGIGEVSETVARAPSRISWDKLLTLAQRLDSSAVAQRLGYFLDLHRIDAPESFRNGLLGLVRPRSKILLGPRQPWGTAGKLVRPWSVVANVPEAALHSWNSRYRPPRG